MYLKEIATCKERYVKISIPGHTTAHASGLFQTQRVPTPYTSQGVQILTSRSDALNEGVCRLWDPRGCARSADLSAAGS